MTLVTTRPSSISTPHVAPLPSLHRGDSPRAVLQPVEDRFEVGEFTPTPIHHAPAAPSDLLSTVTSVVAARAQLAPAIRPESRGPPGSPVRQAMDRMLARAATQDATLSGNTVTAFLKRYFLENPKVSNELLLSMEQVPLSKLAASDRVRGIADRKFPGWENDPSHRFGIGLFHAALGIDVATLSHALPDVGITGSMRILGTGRVPRTPQEEMTTALHDFTDLMTQRGDVKLNGPVWGYADWIRSAAASYRGLPI